MDICKRNFNSLKIFDFRFQFFFLLYLSIFLNVNFANEKITFKFLISNKRKGEIFQKSTLDFFLQVEEGKIRAKKSHHNIAKFDINFNFQYI